MVFLATLGVARGEPVQFHTLDNGLRLLVLEKHSVPVVSVQVWYQAGSAHETDGSRGIAHLFEHMMFRGSENYEPEEHSRLIHDVGGDCNAFTAEHVTGYEQTVPSQHIELVFRLEADRMARLRLNQEVLDTERQVVLEEFHHYLNNPFARAFLEFRKCLYVRHPYRWTPLGELDDLAKLSVDDCLQFYRTHYAPNNAALIIAGDVDGDAALALAQKHFGPIPKVETPGASYEMEPQQTETRHFRLKLPLEVPVVALAFRVPEARHDDLPALAVLDRILTNDRSSRLRENVIKEQRLAVEVGGQLLANKDPGLYACFAAYLPNRKESTIVEGLLREIRQIQNDGVEPDELEAARDRFLSAKVFELYSVDAIAMEIGHASFVEGDYRRYETVRERIEKVTAADVQRVAKQYLSAERMNVLAVKPEKFRLKYWLGGLFYSLMK